MAGRRRGSNRSSTIAFLPIRSSEDAVDEPLGAEPDAAAYSRERGGSDRVAREVPSGLA